MELNDEYLAERAIVVVRQVDALDAIEGKILEQRLNGQEAAEAYLYLIPAKGERKPILGATVDFVRQIVRSMNLTGRTQLTIATEQPPVVQDVLINGKAYVRVLVCAIDRKTGEGKWGVKEEPRQASEGQPLPHAVTIAVEKAERKALESHPSYNRKFVNRKIREFVVRAGLDPTQFIIGGGTGQWSDFFGRAKRAGVSADTVRATVRARTGGKGLSQIETREEMQAAASAVDEAIPPAPPASAADAADVQTLRAAIFSTAARIGVTKVQLADLWARVGSPERTLDDYRRLRRVLELLSVGVALEPAIAQTQQQLPKEATT